MPNYILFMDKQREKEGLKSSLKISAILIIGVFVVLGVIVAHEMQYVDEYEDMLVEYNVTMGDRYETDDGVKGAPEGFQYAHVWIRHHNWSGEKVWISPAYYTLHIDGVRYNQSIANIDSSSAWEGYLSNNYMQWFLVLFEVPEGTTTEGCSLKWQGQIDARVESVKLDTIFDSDEDYVKGWNPIPEWPGVITYSVKLSDTFAGQGKYDTPGSGNTYAIVEYTIRNNSYTGWASNGISNNSYNFQLDLNGILYGSASETYDVPGYALIEVRPGYSYSGTVIFEVPRGHSASEFILEWDGNPEDLKIDRI